MNRGKWFVRSGMLILLLGFFMPTMLVSCSGMTGFEQSFSLADMASQFEQPVLYLFLLGALAAGVFSFLPARGASEARAFLLAQLAAVGIGLLSMAISVLSLTSMINEGTYGVFKMRPDYGVFVLAGGLVLFAVGWFEQWAGQGLPFFSAGQPRINREPQVYREPPPTAVEDAWRPQDLDDMTPQVHAHNPAGYGGGPAGDTARVGWVESPASLEPVRGSLPPGRIPIDYDNFTIGRGSDNSLIIHDTSVSRHHAKMRYAQGSWFIQDTDSASGVIVNGEAVPAARLEPGDKIEISGNVFVFRC